MTTFHELEFAFMTDETFKRFIRPDDNIIRYPTYFKESIDLLCRIVEVGFTVIIMTSNIVRLISLLASFWVTLMILNSMKVIYILLLSIDISDLGINLSKSFIHSFILITLAFSCLRRVIIY